MNNVALDTNAYRALDDGDETVARIIRQTLVIGIPVIVLGELYFGFENGNRKEENFLRLEQFLKTQRLEVLQLTPDTARIFGEIAAELETTGKRIQQNDTWIAALCKQYGFTLLTADKGYSYVKGLNTLTF